MKIEDLLNWAIQVLQHSDSALTAETLAERLEHEFHATLAQLEVLLLLDKRFLRNADRKWQINPACGSDAHPHSLADQAFVLREQAIQALLEELHTAEHRLVKIRERLDQIDESLVRLGLQGMHTAASTPSRDGSYSLEYHLRGLPQQTCELALEIHQAIVNLPNTHPKFNKFHIAYSVGQRFAMLIPRKGKLDILVKAAGEFEDLKGWTRDATSRRLGLERIFSLDSTAGIEYAMQLIAQAHRKTDYKRKL